MTAGDACHTATVTARIFFSPIAIGPPPLPSDHRIAAGTDAGGDSVACHAVPFHLPDRPQSLPLPDPRGERWPSLCD